MDKEFVPYEPSLALKELEFNEPCLGNFADDEKHTLFTNGNRPGKIDAPTFSQAFRWFREKYKIHSIINLTIIGTWYFELYDLNDKRNAEIKTNQNEFETPEEAELACLIKLIEIVKEKKNG